MQTMSLMMRAFDAVVATRARVKAIESAIQVCSSGFLFARDSDTDSDIYLNITC